MNTSYEKNYSQLFAYSRECTLLESIEGILGWDQETYMPSSAIGLRSSQMELLAHLRHKHATSPKFKRLLSSLIDLKSGDYIATDLPKEKWAALREWRRDFLQASKLPSSFVRLFAKTTSEAQHVFATAKDHADFSLLAPHLEKIVSLNRRKADYLGFEEHPYDALLDLYEPGMTIRELVPLFFRLKEELLFLVKEIQTKEPPRTDFLHKEYSQTNILRFSHLLLKTMGFSSETSRLDLSVHPFCASISPYDTRMTTHMHNNDPMGTILAVLHEGGHGLYSMGRPAEHFGSPLCMPVSLGIDESQSRFWETLIGLGLPFWRYFFPILQEECVDQLGGIDFDTFYRAINHVHPSCIRIHADEVTYNLHIILRLEIEKALIEGTLKVKEIPELWNEKMETYLGIRPKNHREGCLQDIHWSMGAIGYFPTYTLGNLYAAELFASFKKHYSEWEERIARGDLGFIREWLKEKIHKFGRIYSPKELIQNATGNPLSETAYISHLKKKFLPLYSL